MVLSSIFVILLNGILKFLHIETSVAERNLNYNIFSLNNLWCYKILFFSWAYNQNFINLYRRSVFKHLHLFLNIYLLKQKYRARTFLYQFYEEKNHLTKQTTDFIHFDLAFQFHLLLNCTIMENEIYWHRQLHSQKW